jgi:hypothetical protein
MLMGDPGSGKTGALAALIKERARFGIERFAILDWDDGLDVLAALLSDEDLDCVYYETLRDELKATQKGVDIRTADAFTRGMALMNNWKAKDVNLGPSLSWGPETVLVNDTITGLGDAAFNFCMAHGDTKGDSWRSIGAAMGLQDKLVQMLVALNCHTILNSHVRYMFGGGKKAVVDAHGQIEYKEVDSRTDGEAYPSALGRQLPPTIGRHFNSILELKLVGKNRRIRTVPEDRMNLKIPFKIKDELPQETGMVEIFDKFLNR